jgi:hypothetical protein
MKLCETEDKSENVGTKDMLAAKAIKVFGEPALDDIKSLHKSIIRSRLDRWIREH